MGIWRGAGAFAVVKPQGECGSKTCEMHVSQPMAIGVCYAVVVFLFFSRLNVIQLNVNFLANSFLSLSKCAFSSKMSKVCQIFILFSFSRCRNTKVLSKQRNQKSNFFPRKHSLDNPKRVFSSFGLSKRVFLFFSFLSCRNELFVRKHEKSRSQKVVFKSSCRNSTNFSRFTS